MRWKFLILLSALGLAIAGENKSDPAYKPLVSPEELAFIDNAEVEEILGNLQMFYKQLKREESTTINSEKKTEKTEEKPQYQPRYMPGHQENQTTNAADRTTTTPKPEHVQHIQPNQIQKTKPQVPVPSLQAPYQPPTQKPQPHFADFRFPTQNHEQAVQQQIHQKQFLSPDTHHIAAPTPHQKAEDRMVLHQPHLLHPPSPTPHQKAEDRMVLHQPHLLHPPSPTPHQKAEEHMIFHQPQVHYQQPKIHHYQPHLHAPNKNLSPRQEIEIEYQYQPHARVIGHLTKDQQIRLYKNQSPDINKIVKDMKYHHFNHQLKNHNSHESQESFASEFESPESHFPEDSHFQSQGAKVELMDENSKDQMVYNSSPGFHLDENESNYYIETLK